MKLLFIPVIFFFVQCIATNERENVQQNWEFVYEHNSDGASLKGTKQELISAIDQGKKVRIGWIMGNGQESVKHYADVQFISVIDDEVFGQIETIIAQIPDFDKKAIRLEEKARWSFIASTSGTHDTFMYLANDHKPVGFREQSWGVKWFVK